MSQNHFNPTCFGIEDKNINIVAAETETDHNQVTEVIYGYLMGKPFAKCPYCHHAHVIRNGFRQSNIHLTSAGDHQRLLRLKKQRWLCHSCQRTFGPQTNLTKGHDSLAQALKSQIMNLVRLGMPASQIALITHCSPSTVIRTIDERVQSQRRVARLPHNLCFDEFRSVKHAMSFICCDADTHQLVAKLSNRLSRSIIDYFENRYSLSERQAVKTVVVDMNAQYSQFIHRLFPKAEIIIDRFHITQLAGRALDAARIQTLKGLSDHRSRTYRIMKSQWRLFHKDFTDINADKPIYLRGVNEYMTQQNAIDLVIDQFPDFDNVYQTYQRLMRAIKTKNVHEMSQLLNEYQPQHNQMDVVIQTLKHYHHYVLNSLIYPYSNGPIEGLNRKIKDLKRHCYGFRNMTNFFKRIDCLL